VVDCLPHITLPFLWEKYRAQQRGYTLKLNVQASSNSSSCQITAYEIIGGSAKGISIDQTQGIINIDTGYEIANTSLKVVVHVGSQTIFMPDFNIEVFKPAEVQDTFPYAVIASVLVVLALILIGCCYKCVQKIRESSNKRNLEQK